jgi:hypothetical protein
VTVKDIVGTLPAHVVTGPSGYQDFPIAAIVAGDLMSDILVSVETDILIVTSLATDQAIRSADIVGARAVLLVNDKLPLPSMKALARAVGITLLATPLPMFESCIALGLLRLHDRLPPEDDEKES